MSQSLALVVPTYGRPTEIVRLIGELRQFDGAPDETIIVAGDAVTAQAARTAGFGMPNLTVLEVENRNAAASRNAGWRAAETDLVVFLDDDCHPPARWAANARAALADPKVTAVGGPVLNPAPERLMARVAQTWLDRRLPTGPAEWVPSQNVVIRRHALVALDGFDESLDAFEDVDFSMRLRAAGYSLFYDMGLAVDHDHRLTLRGFLRQHRGYGRGFSQFAKKEPSWDQAGRAPLTTGGTARAAAIALVRPLRCAWSMPRPSDRVIALPVFAAREVAFLVGAVSEAR